MNYQYDLFVIGAGSGGVRASRIAAAKGYRVAVAESSALGGTCVNVGCVPKKLFVYGAEYGHSFEEARGFGWQANDVSFDWSTLRDRKTQEIQRLNGIYQNLLEKAGVEIIRGHARFLDAHTVEVDGQQFTADKILIAVGARSFVPDIPGKEYLSTSNDMFYLDSLPKRALVIGAGYIAVEFAGILNGLGVDTVLAYRGERLLKGFDDDIRLFAQEEYRKSGIDVRLNTDVVKVEALDGKKNVYFQDGTSEVFDLVLAATGRVPNIDQLNLNAAGIEPIAGAIDVDENFRTTSSNIYALGDVTNRMQLTPVAIAEAMALIQHWFEDKEVDMDYSNVPTAVFSQPQIGTVGMSEQDAEAKGLDFRVYQTDFRAMKHTLSGSNARSMMKLLVENGSDKVIGAHMVGDYAGEIMQGIGIAMKAGATKSDFDATVGIHPTSAEEFVTFSEASLKPRS